MGTENAWAPFHHFGRLVDPTADVATDVWSGAGAQPIWLAPTAPRTTMLVSTDAADSIAGTGARTVRINGIADWIGGLVSEVVEMNGTTPVPSVLSYVFQDLSVESSGSLDTNVGTITSTADVDGTITQQITAGDGASLACIAATAGENIVGLSGIYISAINGPAPNARAEIRAMVNECPDVDPNAFLTKAVFLINPSVSSVEDFRFNPIVELLPPAIMKLQVTADDGGMQFGTGISGLSAKKNTPVRTGDFVGLPR